WNELRAALSYENMVGLAYIHDPARDPRLHLAEAEDLRRSVAETAEEALATGSCCGCCNGSDPAAAAAATVAAAAGSAVRGRANRPESERAPQRESDGGGHRLEIFVFILEQERGVNGHLVVAAENGEAEGKVEGETADGAEAEAEAEAREGEEGARLKVQSGRGPRQGRAVTLEEYVASLESGISSPLGRKTMSHA
ncbi:hypothetical protein Vafri_823, partial [Volvox africanus]